MKSIKVLVIFSVILSVNCVDLSRLLDASNEDLTDFVGDLMMNFVEKHSVRCDVVFICVGENDFLVKMLAKKISWYFAISYIRPESVEQFKGTKASFVIIFSDDVVS